MAMTLTEFTRSLDPKMLPRILQIQSGFYCQGAVYELFGRECCLSTGDLMKIIDISITRFIAQTADASEIKLPLEYPGLFRIVSDSQPYLTIKEIVDSLKISSHRLGQPAFISANQIQLPQGSVKEKEGFCITAVTLDAQGGGHVDCELLYKEPKFSFRLDLSQEGHFTECEDDQFYTLRELAEWKIPKGRKRTVTVANAPPPKDMLFSTLLENISGELTLTPVYELQAVMQLRKSVALIPSNMDVEVMDVTEQFDVNTFIQPLSLQDVFQKPSEIFPMVADVIERPLIERHMPEDFVSLLRSEQVIIHRVYEAKRILATEIRQESPRHFLIPATYKGRLKRRPREFPTAYDLERARSDTEQLHVVATRGFDSTYSGLASVLVGDEFVVKKSKSGEVVCDGNRDLVDALTCMKIKGKTHEPVRIPMCLDGGFMEVIHDKRQYSISEVCHWFPLPFNVKVSVRDLSLKEDILASVPGLRIEEEITDPYLLISTLDLSSWWEVPVNRTHMIVHLEKSWTGGVPTSNVNSAIEEISEDSYYTMRRYVFTTVMPPPRPPKKPKQPPARPARPQPNPRPEKPTNIPASCSPKSPRPAVVSRDSSTDRSHSTVRTERTPKSPATLPKPVLQKAVTRGHSLEDVCINLPDEDDPHDYEYIDEDQLDNIRKQFHEQSISVPAKGKPSNTI
ncbi:protein THEMIS [Colossoma macropomum]|uniref:protein THEMIS n=1 Tax=Colossoma macropomum TaxID=42526 RepID=UPI001864A7BD|nr:protein THEMIS [Colossoma macropomum]